MHNYKKYEIRANKYAYEIVKKEISKKLLGKVRRLSCYVIEQQLTMTIMIGVLILCGLSILGKA